MYPLSIKSMIIELSTFPGIQTQIFYTPHLLPPHLFPFGWTYWMDQDLELRFSKLSSLMSSIENRKLFNVHEKENYILRVWRQAKSWSGKGSIKLYFRK